VVQVDDAKKLPVVLDRAGKPRKFFSGGLPIRQSRQLPKDRNVAEACKAPMVDFP